MTSSWYSISISLENGGGIFNGYFSVDNSTNLVTKFYETINGFTNFNNNILIPTGTGSYSGNYLGFKNYSIGGFAMYDNAYLSNWLQFDNYGVIINSMSKYPQYNKFNLWAEMIGDETKNNIGIVGNNQLLRSLFTIKPVISPVLSFYSVGVSHNNSDIELSITNVIIDKTKFVDNEKIALNIIGTDNPIIPNGVGYNKNKTLITDLKIENIPILDDLNSATDWNITWKVETDRSLKLVSYYVKK